MKKMSLPQTVITLGIVSLLTDISSEMIYPLLPIFLSQSLGAAPWAIGLIEGLAETIASLLKLYSGKWSDWSKNKKNFLIIGYGISGAARPLVGFASHWVDVLLIRFSDRVGKGIRTSPRDYLIGSSVPENMRGRAFGFHRSMDHLGALLGPLIATLLMTQFLVSEKNVFLWAYIPAGLAFLAVLFLFQEKESTSENKSHLNEKPLVSKPIELSKLFSVSEFPKSFKIILLSLLIFTLGNSADAFLLMRLHSSGVKAAWLPLIWSIFHAVKMISSLIGGSLADRWGRKKVLISGWIFYTFIYGLFALNLNSSQMIFIFIIYGIYYGLTEPTEKAWIVDLAPVSHRGHALGLYNAMIGFGSLPASLIFGLIWQWLGPSQAFLYGAICSLLGCVILSLATSEKVKTT